MAVKRFLSGYEQRQMREDQAHCRATMESPHSRSEDKTAAANALRRLQKAEADQSPPDLTPKQRDQAQKSIAEMEAKIKEGMLSAEEMRRCPSGAVTQSVKWEKANKTRIRRWRNGLRALNRGMDEHELSELCSVERLRPRTSRLNMQSAEIPAKSVMSLPPEHLGEKAGWPYVDREAPAPADPPKIDEMDICKMSFEELERETRPEEPDPLGG